MLLLDGVAIENLFLKKKGKKEKEKKKPSESGWKTESQPHMEVVQLIFRLSRSSRPWSNFEEHGQNIYTTATTTTTAAAAAAAVTATTIILYSIKC